MKLIHFEYSNKIRRFAVKSVVEKAFCCNYFRITGLLQSTNVEVFFTENRSAFRLQYTLRKFRNRDNARLERISKF